MRVEDEVLLENTIHLIVELLGKMNGDLCEFQSVEVEWDSPAV